MKPEAQRIAIAEAVPNIKRFTSRQYGNPEVRWSWRPDENHAWRECYLNDPLSDLNAMHKAEETLDEMGFQQYLHELTDCCQSDPNHCPVTATAAQRAEAFLRTLNLWKDE